MERRYVPDLLMGVTIEAENGAVRSIWLGEREHADSNAPLLLEAERQLREYEGGTRRDFELPLDLRGTAFQIAVWRALTTIPYGETRSYRDIAEAVDRPKGFQAIGQANTRNPIPIVVPCHRVINADGSMGGYGGGPARKQYLLGLERRYR
jgi:methylated-DNA-[protein]-cysteine S-methyltransferase